jgi:hypothetical protein
MHDLRHATRDRHDDRIQTNFNAGVPVRHEGSSLIEYGHLEGGTLKSVGTAPDAPDGVDHPAITIEDFVRHRNNSRVWVLRRAIGGAALRPWCIRLLPD